MTYAGAVLTIIIGKDYHNSKEIIWSVVLFFSLIILAWLTVKRGNLKGYDRNYFLCNIDDFGNVRHTL